MSTSLNVKDFGATGLGIDDDTSAIQLALDVAATDANRNEVYLPPGIYKITGPLKLYRASGVVIRGAGNGLGAPGQIGGYAGRGVSTVLQWAGIDKAAEVKSISSIQNLSGTVATVTTSSAHGMSTGQRVTISGANQATYNGSWVVTVTGSSTFTYDFTSGTPVTPATGTITYVGENAWSAVLVLYGCPGCVIRDLVVAGRPTAFGTTTFTANAGTDQITSAASLGALPNSYACRLTTTGSLPGGLNTSSTYYGRWNTDGSGPYKLFATAADAIANTNAIDITSAGSGTHTVNLAQARAGIVEISDPGWPSGKSLFEHITFRQCQNGVQLGDALNDNNCADNTFVHCDFRECTNGIYASSDQVLNNVVINGEFSGCTYGIYANRGGGWRVLGASMNGQTGTCFFKWTNAGGNAIGLILDGVRLERNNDLPTLLDIAADYTLVDIRNFQTAVGASWNGSDPWAKLIVAGYASTVTISSSTINGPLADLTGNGSHHTTLTIKDCLFFPNQTPATSVTADSLSYWKSVDCLDIDGIPLLDDGNWPTDTLVSRVTSDQTISNASITPISGLAANVLASRTYSVRLVAHFTSTAGAEGIKFDFGGGSATKTDWIALYNVTDSNAADFVQQRSSNLSDNIDVATVGTAGILIVEGTITVDAAGTLIPRAAQSSHTAGSVTIKRGSHMVVKQMA